MERLLTIMILCFLLLHGNSFRSYGRTFKTLTGVPIEGSFVALKTGGPKEIAVLKLDRTAKLHEIPLARLSPSDQHFVKFSHTAQLSRQKHESHGGSVIPLPYPSGPSIFSQLDSKLVALRGNSLTAFKGKDRPDYYSFCFSAGSCGPCREFTPRLVQYDKNMSSSPALDLKSFLSVATEAGTKWRYIC